MPSAKAFTVGTGCFTCRICGRKTRESYDRDAARHHSCPQCWELAGLQNEECDGYATDEDRARIVSLRDEIRTLGGTPDEF